jgi:uncharacterized protein
MKCNICKVACWLLLLGGLNMGLIGLGSFVGSDLDVVHMVLGSSSQLEMGFYVLVGLGALGKIFKCCPCCKKK